MSHSDTPVTIAGAGIMGLSAGHALARAGFDVTLYDPAPQTSASAGAGGMLAPYSEIEYLPAEFIAPALAGIESWKQALAGTDIFLQEGTLVVAHEGDEYLLPLLSGKLETFGVCEKTNPGTFEPQLKNFAQGLYISGEAHLDTPRALDYLADRAGTRVQAACDFKKPGWIIDCRGYTATTDDPDLRGVRGESILVRNREFSLQRPVRLMHPRYPLYIVPRPGNLFMIGATTIENACDENISVRSALELLSAAYSLHPSFGESEIIDIRAAIRPAYPDNLPRITAEGNIIRCNGLFRHGFLLAPVMAECVTDMIAGRDNAFTHLFMRENDDHHAQRPVHHLRRRA